MNSQPAIYKPQNLSYTVVYVIFHGVICRCPMRQICDLGSEPDQVEIRLKTQQDLRIIIEVTFHSLVCMVSLNSLSYFLHGGMDINFLPHQHPFFPIYLTERTQVFLLDIIFSSLGIFFDMELAPVQFQELTLVSPPYLIILRPCDLATCRQVRVNEL